MRLSFSIELADSLFDVIRHLFDFGSWSDAYIHLAERSPPFFAPIIKHQRAHRMLQALEVEILHHTDNLRVIHVSAHKAPDMVLREHLHKRFVGDKTTRLALIVRLPEITAIHNLKPEELHEVNIDGQHFHKHLLAVISSPTPAHLLVRNKLGVTESHGFNRRILQQETLQGIFLTAGPLPAPSLKDTRFIESHILVHHILCLYANEKRHQYEEE